MILFKYATKSRPYLFLKGIRNIESFTHSPFKIIVSCDKHDTSMNRPNIIQHIHSKPNWGIYFGPSISKVHAINRDMEHSGEWDMLVNFSDDMQFMIPGWDNILMAMIKNKWGNSTDYFAHCNDGYLGSALPTMSIMGREYYERDNYIYHPDYSSFSCDAEAMYVAMTRKRYQYFNNVFFKHEHPANNRRLRTDRLYIENGRRGGQDTATYFRRLNNNFDLTEVIPGPYAWEQYKTI